MINQMASTYLTQLILCLEIVTIAQTNIEYTTLNSNKKPNESTNSNVLPYTLQKKKNYQNIEKQYTLVTASTVSTVVNSKLNPSKFYENMHTQQNNRSLVRSANFQTDKIENVLAKTSDMLDDWVHHKSHIPLGHKIIAEALRHYYINTGDIPPSHGYGAHFPAVSITLLLILNLGLISYVLLGILGLIHRILNLNSYRGLGGGYSTATSNSIHDNLGYTGNSNMFL